MKSLKYNAIINGVLSISNIIFPLITFPYISRVLLVEANGRLNFASSVVASFSLFAMLGVSTYGIKACAQAREDRDKLSKTVHELLFINISSTMLALTTLIITILLTPRLRQEWVLLIIYSCGMILNIAGMNWLYAALEEYDYITKRSIFFKILGIILMFIFVHKPEDCYIYGVITIISNAGGNILNIIHAKKYINIKWYGNYNCKQHLKPTLAMFFVYLATNVYSSLDSVMLGFFKGDYHVGIYAAAIRIKTVLTTLITSLSNVLLPRMSYYVENGRLDDFRRILKKAYSVIIILSVPMMVYFALSAEHTIVFLSGEAYWDAIKPMQILMPLLFMGALSNVTSVQILVPTGGEWKFAFSVSCGAVLNVILNFTLIPQYGVVGAAYATLVTEPVQTIIQMYFCREYLKGVFSIKSIVQVIIATLGGTLAFMIVNTNIHLNAFFSILLTAAAFFSVYALLLLFQRHEMFLEMCGMVIKPLRLKQWK